MKKFLTLILCAAAAVQLTGCGVFGADGGSNDTSHYHFNLDDAKVQPKADEGEPETDPADPERQICHKTLSNPEKPEIVRIWFSGECSDSIKAHSRVSDIYNIDYLHSGVVGLVGSPVELEFDENVTKPVMSFEYDEAQLRGIPVKNLIVLHYSEKDQFYNTIGSYIEMEKNRVSFIPEEPGVYLLADAYQWLGVWGYDVSEYEYTIDKSDYPTDWERELDTGSIIELCDKKWAVENAPDFHVSTPWQLASVVYYVNGINESDRISLTLEDDIDLSGYRWTPMGWYAASNHGFCGTVDGKGHTISHMNISASGYMDMGFIGYGMGVDVHDISFDDASVASGGCTGIVGGQMYGFQTFSNVSVSGRISGGREDYGCIIGRETDTKFINCTADVTVDGEPFQYLSYRQKREDEVEIVETFTLKLNSDHTITRDDHEGFHNLQWYIHKDGKRILGRGAEDFDTKEPELVLHTHDLVGDDPGTYTVYLVAYINGTYIRVSNIIEYDI